MRMLKVPATKKGSELSAATKHGYFMLLEQQKIGTFIRSKTLPSVVQPCPISSCQDQPYTAAEMMKSVAWHFWTHSVSNVTNLPISNRTCVACVIRLPSNFQILFIQTPIARLFDSNISAEVVASCFAAVIQGKPFQWLHRS